MNKLRFFSFIEIFYFFANFLLLFSYRLSHLFPRCFPLPHPSHSHSQPPPSSVPMSPPFLFLKLDNGLCLVTNIGNCRGYRIPLYKRELFFCRPTCLFIYFHIFLLLFKYSCLHFSPTLPSHPSHPHFPPLILLPFGFVHVSFIQSPETYFFNFN